MRNNIAESSFLILSFFFVWLNRKIIFVLCSIAFTCCSFSNNSCLVAEFLTKITDSVFSRLGLKKSNARCDPVDVGVLLLMVLVLFAGGVSFAKSRLVDTKSVSMGSPFDLLRWNIALERCGAGFTLMDGFGVRSPKIAE